VDDDGDGAIDEGFTPATWYPDDDGDGVGEAGAPIESCFQPEGTVPPGGDGDDSDPSIFPGQSEWCNGVDDNCDGTVDGPTSVDTVSRYPDADGDGYGLDPRAICPDEDGPGWLRSSAGYDCDDTHPLIHPDATEACNGVDDDCDATTGEATSPTGLHSNTALEGDGAWMAAGGRFEGIECDMGRGPTDNLVHDVAWEDLGTWGMSRNGPDTFSCINGGCE